MLVLGGRGAINPVVAQGRGASGNGLLANLIAYWKLDEASGNAVDAHSNGLTLTAANVPGNSTGKVYATARTFNGSSQYFSRTSSATLQTGDIDFALAAWVYLSSTSGAQEIIGKWNYSSGKREFRLAYNALSTNKWQFFVTPDGTTVASVSISDSPTTGAWNLLVAQHDAANNQISIALNGGTPEIAAHTTGVLVSDSSLGVGAVNGSPIFQFFNGRIGPVAFWKNRTLSAADRTALWNGGNGLAYSGFS